MERVNNFLKDEHAIAYGIVVIFAILLIASVFLIVITPALNMLIVRFNQDYVSTGIASEETVEGLNFSVTMFKMIPVFTVLGVAFLYAVIRALLKKSPWEK